MSVATLKSALASALAGVEDIGTVDAAPLDPDDLPRLLRGVVPYWSLRLTGASDRLDGFGGGGGIYPTERTYLMALEGWRGIVASAGDTAAWEALVESVLDALTVAQPALGIAAGFLQWESLGSRDVKVVQFTGEGTRGTRAHHALIEGRAVTFRRITV